MKANLSKENSERVLSGTKWIANAGQDYLVSLNAKWTKSTSSGKKLINAFFLVPVIIPTAITVSLIVCTCLFLDAVDVQKNDSKLSKIAKGLARIFIYIVAAVILIPCIMSNLVTSLIPGLIFYCINKDTFSQKNTSIEDQTANKVKINNDKEYNKCVEEEVGQLGQQDNADQGQSTVKVMSRVMEDEQAIDRTVIVELSNDDIRDGKGMIRTATNNHNVAMKGIIAGNLPDQTEGFGFQCDLIKEGGIDFQCGFNTRTGINKGQAIERLRQSESAQTLLSGDGGILSIEQHSSTRQK